MEVSQQELIKIVERSSTITERFSNCFIPDRAKVNEQQVKSRLESWCQVVAQGDPKTFAKRLAWDNLDVDAVSRVLGAVRLTDTQHLPGWAKTLQSALQADLEPEDALAYRCLDQAKPIPFEEVYLPFVQVARQKLLSQTGVNYQLLSEAAHTKLERELLWRLASLCAQPLYIEFSIIQVFQQSSLSRLLGRLQSNPAKELYQGFVKGLLSGGLLSFFQKYSVLARLIATALDFWVEAIAELLLRLASDLPRIQQTFPGVMGQVVAIQPGLSDYHNRGRCVIALTFASGLKLIYKPRDLGLETAYFQLLDWCNQQGVLLPFQLLKVINCTTHGWMEYAEHLPCVDATAAQRYYQRSGMLLCLLYVLEATDCHHENLIACGEQPLLVDLEALMHPQAHKIDDQEDEEVGVGSLASQQLLDSVLRTGLLPRWEFGADGQVAYDVSGLGGSEAQKLPFQMPKWQHINTDIMTLEYESGFMQIQDNVPSLNDLTLSPNDYVDELIDGFQKMYHFLMERQEAFRATDSPLATLAHQRVRFLFRATEVYSFILGKTLQPKFLQDGADHSIQLDVVSRALLAVDKKPYAWPLLAMELRALEQLDIPYFATASDSDALRVNSELVIKEYFKEAIYDRVIYRLLHSLSEADLAKQIAIIRGSLYSQVARVANTASPSVETLPTTSLSWEDVTPLTQEQLVHSAMAIAQELQQRSIHSTDGSVTWIGMGYLPEARRFQLQPLGYSLYDGICGVALFLAALGKITGDAQWRDLALRALQNIDLKSQPKIPKQINIGGATGLGSIVYTLVRISQFLDEPYLLDVARRAASLITPERIASDRQFDTMAGAAGAILGLLALHQATLEAAALEKALACGYHLLDNRVGRDSKYRTRATGENKLMTGFSHGAAGIAYALLQLYKTKPEQVFWEAASEAIAYERSVFSPTAGNWPEAGSAQENGGKPSFMTSWCAGAPGIGLARLGGLTILDTVEIRQEIAVALNTTQQFSLQPLDQLCCGNFGRIEVLLVAAQKLSHPELWSTAQKQAAQVVARAKQEGTFYLFPELHINVYDPGFFQGTTGIGYQLLRLAYPNLLPSVLLWE